MCALYIGGDVIGNKINPRLRALEYRLSLIPSIIQKSAYNLKACTVAKMIVI